VTVAPKLKAAALSDPGREREINEDRVLADPERGIFAVIDGVGGESSGEVAAEIALEVLRARLSRRTTDAERLIREAIALANRQIYERARAEPRLAGMACVLTVAVVEGGRDAEVTVGHVGDSRLYLLRRGEIRKVTRDHSPVGEREDAGEISEADAMRHPRRNEIFRDVGSAPHEPDEPGFVEIDRLRLAPDAALLLCSDGLSDLLTAQEIRAAVEGNAADPEAAVHELIAAANAAGGKDNISAVLVAGERFARGVPARSSSQASVSPYGAARARARGGERLRAAMTGRAAFLLYGFLAGLAAVVALAAFAPDSDLLNRLRGGGGPVAETLQVAPGGGTLGEALERARPGQTVEVAPGEYRERIRLRDGVSLVSVVPRGAVLVPPAGPPDSPAAPAVIAEGVQGGRFAGFRIAGGTAGAGEAGAPLAVGLRLADSAVEVEGLEISGATVAAVEIAGADRSTLSFSSLHGNPGAAIAVADRAAPRLLFNLVSGNGAGAGGGPRPGVEIGAGCRPVLIENRFLDNAGPPVRTAAIEGGDEIFRWNSFGATAANGTVTVLSRAQAVRGPEPAAVTPASAPRPAAHAAPPRRSMPPRPGG